MDRMTKPHDIQALVQSVAKRVAERRMVVAVVGDMILDNSIEGIAAGKHPDIAVPILREATSQESIGGAANIALGLARLGIEVVLFGVIGSDLHGRQLENLLDRQPFLNHLVTERGWPTPHKDWIYARQDDRLSLIQRIDYDRPLSSHARVELVGEFRVRCPQKVDVVILADHNLGSIGPESLDLIDLAKQRQAKLVAIPRTTILRGQPLDAMVLNGAEMRSLYNADNAVDPRPLAARYAREYAQHVFLTLWEEGILVCPAGMAASGTLIPSFPLTNPQWMGARDMATALIAVGLVLDLDPIDNAKVANAFRSLVANQRGSGRVLWRDVFQLVGLSI
jgi:D-beta-D-heptose 7-phosphate kinase/D-beta-D-heptose 1-phosphate adenosyltransferase